MSHKCTTDDCLNHTDTYLCTACVRDLQAWLDKVDVLIETLGVTIAKLDHVRPAGGGWNSGSKPGSAAPINLDALQLQQNLMSVGSYAPDYARDERAAGIAWMIRDWIIKAELLVSGPEEPPVNHAANRERIKNAQLEPMPTRKLVPWLRENASISITGKDIRNWAYRGKLRAVEDRPSPTYNALEVIDAWYETRREGSRT